MAKLSDFRDAMDDRKRWCNFAYRRRRSNAVVMVTSLGLLDGRCSARKEIRLKIIGVFEDTKIAIWPSDEARCLPRDVRRTCGSRRKMIDCLRRFSEPCLHDQVQRRATVASKKDVIDCRACICCLVELGGINSGNLANIERPLFSYPWTE